MSDSDKKPDCEHEWRPVGGEQVFVFGFMLVVCERCDTESEVTPGEWDKHRKQSRPPNLPTH